MGDLNALDFYYFIEADADLHAHGPYSLLPLRVILSATP
jgi:hypothetical protein